MSAPEARIRTVAKAAPTDSTTKPRTIRAIPQARRHDFQHAQPREGVKADGHLN
jgi:hypothetical protein